MGPVKNDWDLKAMLRPEQTSKEKSLSKLDQFKQSWEIKVGKVVLDFQRHTHYGNLKKYILNFYFVMHCIFFQKSK